MGWSYMVIPRIDGRQLLVVCHSNTIAWTWVMPCWLARWLA